MMKRSREADDAFDRALALDSDEDRQAFLRRLNSDDPALHQEVLRLIELSDRAKGFEHVVRRLADESLRSGLDGSGTPPLGSEPSASEPSDPLPSEP